MVDFVLVTLILVPLFLGLVQVGLVLYVRTAVAAAASEGAQYAARLDRSPAAGLTRIHDQLAGLGGARFVRSVHVGDRLRSGVPMVEVDVVVRVPALGLWGPAVEFVVHGHAVREVAP